MFDGWTYGAELELSDFDRRGAPAFMEFDLRDVTMVNSNGVAVDPRGELYHLGGEIKTVPSATAGGQAEQLERIMRQWPETKINYRSNLHVHVRVPGLINDLSALKRIQQHVHHWLPDMLKIKEPIPEDFGVGARRRYNRRKISHQKFLTPQRLEFQLQATDPVDFFRREVLDVKTGRLNWAISPRLCVNLRQLKETDTVEFRHFPGTLQPIELAECVRWCRNYMARALEDTDPRDMLESTPPFPRFLRYVHWMEVGYLATSRKYHKSHEVKTNIAAWLDGGQRAAQEEFGL